MLCAVSALSELSVVRSVDVVVVTGVAADDSVAV